MVLHKLMHFVPQRSLLPQDRRCHANLMIFTGDLCLHMKKIFWSGNETMHNKSIWFNNLNPLYLKYTWLDCDRVVKSTNKLFYPRSFLLLLLWYTYLREGFILFKMKQITKKHLCCTAINNELKKIKWDEHAKMKRK